MHALRLIPLITAALALSACSVAPRYQPPAVALPLQWETHLDSARAQALERWWQHYGSSELDELMARALAHNYSVAAAISRIDQARASLTVARAALFPNLGVTANTSSDHQHRSGADSSSHETRMGVAASYEIDLWGKNRNASVAARARMDAAEFNRRSVELVLQTDVVTTYLQHLALQDRLRLTQRNLEAAQALLELVQVRFDNGAATALDVAQQRTVLLGIQTQIPGLEQSLTETRHALAVLLALPPQALQIKGHTLADLSLPNIAAEQPARLLERRPDLRIAEAGLMAANADIGIARAAWLPSLNLSASAAVGQLFASGTSVVTSLAASLGQTLFNGGRITAQVRLAQATQAELAAQYAQAVLNGLRETEDSLAAISSSRQRLQFAEQTAEQARIAYKLARVRFDAGAIDSLTLLDSQRTQLSSEDARVQAQLQQLSASAGLVKALGGGWAQED